MHHKIFSVYDEAAGAYLVPFFLPNENMAIRTFRDCARNPGHAFCANPADYTLFLIGEFNDATGELVPVMPLQKLGSALEHRSQDLASEAFDFTLDDLRKEQ